MPDAENYYYIAVASTRPAPEGMHEYVVQMCIRDRECIEAARAQGQDVTSDFYPYDGGSTTLLSLLPPTLAEYPPPFFAGHELSLIHI